MKKLLTIVALILTLSLSTLLVVACNPEHEHTFDTTKWESDATNHWHKATCEHTDLRGDEAQHSFVDGECSICHRKQEGEDEPEKNKETDGHDYKVTVKGPDGKPFTDGKVQVCEPAETGGSGGLGGNQGTGQCFAPFLSLDSNGVCYIDNGMDLGEGSILPGYLQKIEIHIQEIPVYLKHDSVIIEKGHAAVIELYIVYTTELEGTGVGEFDNDVIKSDSFYPYKMNEGAYKITVSDKKTAFIVIDGEYAPETFSISLEGADGTITVLAESESAISKTDLKAENKLDIPVDEEYADGTSKSYRKYIMIEFGDDAVGKEVSVFLEYKGELQN